MWSVNKNMRHDGILGRGGEGGGETTRYEVDGKVVTICTFVVQYERVAESRSGVSSLSCHH